MKIQHCPVDRLRLLIQDALPTEESGHVLSHIEECLSCQSTLETLAADRTWWDRATRGLSGVALDDHGGLPEPHESVCSVEALLEVHPSGERPNSSATADLAVLDPPRHPEMLGRIDEFDIEEKIGQGGMGIVYRGFDRSLNRPVAVKVMAPHLGANSVARMRFAREAQAAAAVVHPHVIPVYRVSSSAERPYIAMALVDGRSLQEHVSRHGPLETKEIVRISLQIADGLAAAHRQGLVHRDMKPANILLDKNVSRVTITDFGLARAIDDVAMTQSGCLAGTPNYMSPEQVTGADIDHRSDLFSLGSVMYFLATGREPFRAESAFAVIHRIMREEPCPAQSIDVDVPPTLDRIIGRLLEKDPANRIESADELQSLLATYLAYLQDPRHHAPPRVRTTSVERKRLRKRVVGGAVFGGLLLACLLWSSFSFSGYGNVTPSEGGAHEESHGELERAGENHEEHGEKEASGSYEHD